MRRLMSMLKARNRYPAKIPTKCAQDRETRQGDRGGQILWRKGELDRIEAHYAERVDLLPHDHRSDLRRNGRRGPAAHTQGGDERAQFPGEADYDQVYYNSRAPNLRSSEALRRASMNAVHSDMAPAMGSALAPIASICSTAERQRLLSPTIGNTRGSFRSTDQNCMVNAPASSTWTIAACPTCSRNVNGTPPPIPTHEKPNPVGLFPRASWPCRLSPSPAVSPNVREQPS